MILLGLGAGIAFNPLLLAAMSDVGPNESGLASGVVNTSFMMGGALGLAVLASIAASRTTAARVGRQPLAALPAATTPRSSSAPSSPLARRRSAPLFLREGQAAHVEHPEREQAGAALAESE